jgi:hypothetical protein
VPTSFTPCEALVRALLSEHPDLPATVIAERVGWEGSITWFRDKRASSATGASAPGCGRPVDVDGRGRCAVRSVVFAVQDPARGRQPGVVAGVGDHAAYYRFMLGKMLPTRRTEDLLLGTWALIEQLGRVRGG